MHSVASVPPQAITVIKWVPFSNDVILKNAKFRFYDCDYFIFCLFPTITLPQSATHNRDHNNSWHRSPTIKPKQKSCHQNIVSVDCGLHLMELMETAVVWLGAVSHLRLGWMEAGRRDKGRCGWFHSKGFSVSQLCTGRKLGQSTLRELHFWNRPHAHIASNDDVFLQLF